jgi:site-specific DNA-methyltransferase (adenine-specific)
MKLYNNIDELKSEELLSPNSLVCSDCFDAMKYIEDKSVDMILADLPFGTTQCKWDSVLPLDELWIHYKRIIKDNGAILLFGQTPFDKVLGCSNLGWLKYEWIWEKTQATGYFNAKKMPMKSHENILVFYENLPKFNPQKTSGHKPINKYTKRIDIQNKTELYGKVNKQISGGGETDRFPRSIQVFSSDKQKTKLDGTIHPTQKPVALLEMLIRSYTDENDIVLDNTAGSSSTAIACIKTNRKWIMIEKEKKYFDLSLRRIENNQKTIE